MVTDNYGNLVDSATVQTLTERLDQGDARMTRIEGSISENTLITQQLAASTAEIVEFFNAVKGAFKVLNWIGKLARPLTAIAALTASGLAAWAAIKGHK
ncbi:MAG: hypothetical protein RBS27_01490 [Giesbergeria sp.]|jgi:hypothetical protein|nr:hypothetical protein [Giesbergeria sp.]